MTPPLFCAQYLTARGERGIVLITALILLVVITLVALLAVQGSISGEQVSRNLRSNTVAAQSAETALRICEADVLSGAGAVMVNTIPLTGTATTPILWMTPANWTNPAMAYTVTAVLANSADVAARTVAVLPRCMIEQYHLLTEDGAVPRQAWQITARGFSADYRVDPANLDRVISGSEVWVQSILRR